MKKTFVTILTILIVLTSLLWLGRASIAKYYYMREFFSGSPAKVIKANEKEFMEDREILTRYSLFYGSEGVKDAGPYLNPMIRWEIGDVAHRGSLVLPDFVHKELEKDWVTKKPLFKKMGLKFKWMEELLEYDFWSLEEGSPAYEEGKKYHTYSFPVPTYRDLITWSKLRYLYGKQTGKVRDALIEVRHLMRLIYTNDTIISSMVVLDLLKIENQFEEILTPKEIEDWKFVPHDHIMRAKRHFYSLPAAIDIRLPDETFEKMIKTTVGLCPMLAEGMMVYLTMRDLLKDELKYGFNRMDEAVKNSNCRKTILHEMWNDPEWPAYPIDGQKFVIFDNTYSWDYVKTRPTLKAALGFKQAALAEPHYFFQYTQETR
ncbi:MAG: hypothetical protein ACLGHN_09170 [Bacteriovoracia bacterium]